MATLFDGLDKAAIAPNQFTHELLRYQKLKAGFQILVVIGQLRSAGRWWRRNVTSSFTTIAGSLQKKKFPAIYNLTSGCDGILLIKRLANLNLVLNTYGCLKQRENAKKIAESPNTLPYVSCKLSTWNKQRVGNHSTIY